MKHMMVAVTAVGFLLLGLFPCHAAYVITSQGARIDGTDIRAKSDGEIILKTPKGSRTFYKGQYKKAVADKPSEIDKAVQMIEAKKYDEAIKLLEGVITKYRYLDWDNKARALLPRVYARKRDYKGAIKSYEKLFAMAPKSREDKDIQWKYRETLLDAKQYTKLEKELNKVIETGSRPDAARAQIMRGDLRMAQGQLEPATLDYLRTVVLFKSEKASQPEALLKAGDALGKLRDARSKEMYKQLVEDYPSSPEAKKARSKL